MRERFIFERSIFEALKSLPERKRGRTIMALLEYAFNDKEPNDGFNKSFVAAIKPRLDADLLSYDHYEMRRGAEYKKWRKEVYKKNGRVCSQCGANNNLQVHHIKPFAEYPELRFNVNNGEVLCEECHRRKHKNER